VACFLWLTVYIGRKSPILTYPPVCHCMWGSVWGNLIGISPNLWRQKTRALGVYHFAYFE